MKKFLMVLLIVGVLCGVSLAKYYPVYEERILEIFRCPSCNELFMKESSFVGGLPLNVSCAVLHAPGTCCHYTDTRITEDQLTEVKAFLRSIKEENNAN